MAYSRDEQLDVHVPDSDTYGDPTPCRRLAEKVVQVGPFTGSLKVRATIDGVNWPVVHTVTGAPAGDGEFVPVPFAVRAVLVEPDGITGPLPVVTLSGFLIG